MNGALTSWRNGAFVAGAAGLAVCALGAMTLEGGAGHFFRAWLVAFNLFTGAAVGALVVLMVQYLFGASWGHVLRSTLESAARTLPLMAVLILPLAVGADHVFPWARFESVLRSPELRQPGTIYADTPEHDHELEHKYPYLNIRWWLIRAAIVFGVWSALWLALDRWPVPKNGEKPPPLAEWCESVSAPGMVLFMVTVTMASIDWGMSLEPHWYSTIYPAMFGMGQVLTGFSLCLAVFLLLARGPEAEKAVARQDLSDMGTVLGASVMIWAYLGFMQLLIIWMGHVPEELPWYQKRLVDPAWRWVAVLLLVGHFALPFGLLMSFDVKRNRARLASVALLVCFLRVADVCWLLIPAFGPAQSSGLGPWLMYPAALVGVGGVWLGVFLGQLGSRPLLAPPLETKEGAHGEAH
jgi:Ni/Fe-hydrogenase subunit HybB-like protein